MNLVSFLDFESNFELLRLLIRSLLHDGMFSSRWKLSQKEGISTGNEPIIF